MTMYEKARSLAEDLLATEIGKKYTDAKFIFENNSQAVAAMREYNDYREAVMKKMNADALTAEEIDAAKEKINDMVADLRSNSVINDMVLAENQFNMMVQNVMGVFNATLTGDIDGSGNGCTGSCSTCGGCH